MEQNMADFLKDAFPETNFEHLSFDDEAATAHSVNVPQNEPDMMDDDNHTESSGSDIDFEWTNREEETMHCFENNRNFSLDEQQMKSGSTLCGSWDDNDTVKNKTQTQNQQLSLHEEDCRVNESEIHDMTSKEQAEDLSVLEMVLPEGTHYGLETLTTRTQESYQMVVKSENESSAAKEERTESDSIEEHVLQHAADDKQLNRFSPIQSTLQDWPAASAEVQSGDEMKEFTEEDNEDHERDKEGLADYPSDLSQSDSGESSEDHESGEPNHMDTKLDEDEGLDCSYEAKNLEEPLLTSREDDGVENKDECMDPADMHTYVKNEDLCVETTTGKSDDDIPFETKQGSFRDDEYHIEIPNIGESSDFGITENFQSSSKDSYMNEEPDYDSDISSDDQEDKPDFTSHTISEDKNKQEHTFTKDFATDWHSIEREVVDVVVKDSQKPEMCDVEGSSSIAASIGAVTESSSGTYSSESRSVVESHSSEFVSFKPDQNDKECSEVLDAGENINTLLPGMFWSVMDEDNLKLDEYDWDINGENVICDEEDNFMEELENDGEETERDWEKEKARIEAFYRYYDEPVEGRSHKVTFCLEPESTQYEEHSDSSEEEPSTICCISELHTPESSSVKQDQSNKEDSHEPSEDSDIRENINTLLMDEDNMNLDEYDRDINEEEEFNKMNSSKGICDDEDDFLERLKNEIERDLQQEQARIEASNRYYEESFEEEQNDVTDRTHKVMLRLHQQSSQNEEDNDSSEQESNTEDDTASVLKTEDQSDSDEPNERRLYTGRYKVVPKGLQKTDKQLKEHPKRNKCLVLLRSVLAVSLATAVGVLSYMWATDSLDWIY